MYYPIFADLRGRECLVVGGGVMAQRKVTGLLRYGAQVTVVSPALGGQLRRYAAAGKIRHVARRFRPTDLRGMWLVIAAINDERMNAFISREAGLRHVFANIVDRQALCSFIAPATARRGPLTIAVSTDGASPTVAKQVRDVMVRTVGSEYPRLARLLKGLRGAAKRRLPEYGDRRRYFDNLTQGRVRSMVRQGRTGAARREALTRLERFARRIEL